MSVANSVQHSAVRNQRPTYSFRLCQKVGIGPRLAFTLVEMLVVITIIAILASLATVAAYKALEAAKRARITAEIANLDSALKAYKEKFGDYPPSYLDHTDTNALTAMKRHLAKAFPRCDPNYEVMFIPWTDNSLRVYYPYPSGGAGTPFNMLWDPHGSTANITAAQPMSGAQALLFWLTSISKDPAHPLSAATADRQSFFDFDKTRITSVLSIAPGWTMVPPSGTPNPPFTNVGTVQCPVYNVGYYIPASGNGAPYYYLEARCYLFHAMGTSPLSGCPYLQEPWDNFTASPASPGLDVGAASASGLQQHDITTDGSNDIIAASFQTFQKLCANPNTFQIISAGLDGNYGTVNTNTLIPTTPPAVHYDKTGGTSYSNFNIYYKSFPTGYGYDSGGADDDNLANFSDKQLGDAKP